MQAGQPLQYSWIRFLEMTELLLNANYSIRSGYCELLLDYICSMYLFFLSKKLKLTVPGYLNVMLKDIFQLSINFPEMHQTFMRVKFPGQLCDRPRFSRV